MADAITQHSSAKVQVALGVPNVLSDDTSMIAAAVALASTVDEVVLAIGTDLHGARFPTEIYTRGCHWIPRMFA
jgi:hypothetical protein